MSSITWLTDYTALTEHVGLVDLAERTQLEFRGADRASFLHNLCTNDIRGLQSFAGCEAFITNIQGKTIGHGLFFSGHDSLVFETVPAQGQKLRQHFEKYLIREKVEIDDRSTDWAQWLVAGKQAEELLQKLLSHGALPVHQLESQVATISQTPVWLRRVDVAGPIGFLVDCRRGDHAHVGSLLHNAGAQRCCHEAVDAARIEAGFPLFGRDITETNLPQEVARDRRAISFKKGCYLGQETVARIDALGHVNRTLVGLHYLGMDVPKVGATVLAGDEPVGTVTSATWSPKLNSPLALGYVRRGHNTPGTRLASVIGPAEVEVIDLAVGEASNAG